VAIARSLINEPRLVLADEPTGNLDSRTAESILTLFEELNAQGRTIVLVTHDPNVAAHARRRVRVHDGKIVSDS
jgi:putative ABC transport system ATP-binding protein